MTCRGRPDQVLPHQRRGGQESASARSAFAEVRFGIGPYLDLCRLEMESGFYPVPIELSPAAALQHSVSTGPTVVTNELYLNWDTCHAKTPRAHRGTARDHARVCARRRSRHAGLAVAGGAGHHERIGGGRGADGRTAPPPDRRSRPQRDRTTNCGRPGRRRASCGRTTDPQPVFGEYRRAGCLAGVPGGHGHERAGLGAPATRRTGSQNAQADRRATGPATCCRT